MPASDDVVSHRAGLLRAPDGEALPQRVVASWQRSADYGVDLETVEPVFSGTPVTDSLFAECGQEVLSGLHRTLENEPISLMLTDADGLVLGRLSGDTSLLRALDAVHLAPGFAFSEREAGTNGLGLALADRVPSVVRAEEHYSLSLCTYTCAAVPVLDPVSGRLEGAVNITTWSRSNSDLLLALAQSAASNTSALMLARSQGRRPRPAPRGEVVRVESARLEPGSGTAHELGEAWSDAVGRAAHALAAGRVVAAVGEAGSGRATLLAQALRRARPHDRILSAAAPPPADVETWLALWAPEVGKPHTGVIVRDVDVLPAWSAPALRSLLVGRPSGAGPVGGAVVGLGGGRPGGTTAGDHPASGAGWAVTAESANALPAELAPLVDVVVEVAPLRDRVEDVMRLAEHVAHRARGRAIEFTPTARRALESCPWPGNVEQLVRAVRHAVSRTNVVDVAHLPAEVLSGSSRALTRIEAFERDEIVRCLTRPGATMKDAAAELGMSRATVYRKLGYYDLQVLRD
ncbi:regulatory Fis family protein [Terracoccus luteus]|uniref:Regulatory Fis family protein n=1 Tax=Terracoccus luteus TaxID=53356 RepID=A0A495XVA3_9MICO|nr:GAF domain-containing protein [Terracoccus luteus]RKT77892.1 regulatory Fis family protein [Terracoccus luteus]